MATAYYGGAIGAYDQYAQQQANNSWQVSVGSSSNTISVGSAFGSLGSWGQQADQVKKKAMTLLESLRDEVGKWHGSLGVL